MTKSNQTQFEEALQIAKELVKRDLTKEEVESIRLKYDNPVAKSIDFRPGETDLTSLEQGKINQLIIRNQNDTLAYLKFINTTLNDILFALALDLKAKGEDDPFGALDKFKGEEYERFKGE